MRKLVLSLLCATSFVFVQAQPWSYDFGTTGLAGTSSKTYDDINNQNSTNAFMPFGNSATPANGYISNYVRCGNGSTSIAAKTFVENQVTSFGSGNYLRTATSASTSLSFLKFAGLTPASRQFYMSCLIKFGNSTGNTDATITTGTWNLGIGNSASGAALAYTSSNVTPGVDAPVNMRWALGSGGAITFTTNSGTNTTGTSTAQIGVTFSQSQNYIVEVFVNNTVTSLTYTKNSIDYTLPAYSYDIWATTANAAGTATGSAVKTNASAVSINTTTFANTINTPLDSWVFVGGSSTLPSNNALNFFLDNLNYSNTLPNLASSVTTYYSNILGGDLSLVANWTSNVSRDCSSGNPTNFTAAGQVFNVLPVSGIASVANNWIVSGANSKVVVGDGTNACNFTIPATNTVTALIDVANTATLSLINTTYTHSLGTLGNTSTVVYGASGAQSVMAAYYANLVFSGTGARNLASNGPVGVTNSITTGGLTLAGALPSLLNINGNAANTLAGGAGLILGNVSINNPNVTLSGVVNFLGQASINENLTIPNTATLAHTGSGVNNNGIYLAPSKTLTIASGGTLSNANASTTASIMSTGSFTNNSNTNVAGTVDFQSGSTYNHTANGGIIPLANWNSNSNCNITGITSATSIVNRNQSFGNFTWNCASQGAAFTMATGTGSATVLGNFGTSGLLTVSSTGLFSLTLPGSNQTVVTVNNYTQTGGTVNLLSNLATGDRTIAVTNNFNLSGGTFTIASAAFTGNLNISGNLIHTVGTLQQSAGNGNITMGGTLAQTLNTIGITGDVNLIVNNSAGTTFTGISNLNVVTVTNGNLSIGDGASVSGNLTLGANGSMTVAPNKALLINNNGTMDFATRSVILQSDGTGTARIGQIFGTLNPITATNVTVQRFIPAGNRKFRFISHPFTTAQNLNVLGNTTVSYTGGTGIPAGFTHTTGTNNPSAFRFTTASANGGSPNDAAWSPFTVANSGTPWGLGEGIRLLVRGAFGEGLDGNVYAPSATTISMTGTINTGNVNVPVVSGGTGATANFDLIGNPYPSPVNLQAVVSAATVLTNKTIYLRNPISGYISYDLALVANANYAIPANAAFFVISNIGGGNIAFAESNKVAAASADVVFSQDKGTTPFIELTTLVDNDVYNNQILKFDNKWNSKFDIANDGPKPSNDIVNAYTLSTDNTRLAVDARPFVDGTIIPLGITLNSGARMLTFKAANVNLGDNYSITLLDKLTNTKTALLQDASYTFTVDNADATTFGDKRFELLLNAKPTVSAADVAATSFKASIVGSNIINNQLQVLVSLPTNRTASVTVTNELGQVIATKQATATGNINFNAAAMSKGLYFVSVQSGDEKMVLKAVKE